MSRQEEPYGIFAKSDKAQEGSNALNYAMHAWHGMTDMGPVRDLNSMELDADTLRQMLSLIAQHTGSTALLVDSELNLIASEGALFQSAAEFLDANAAVETTAQRLGDRHLRSDLYQALAQNISPERDFATPEGFWLKRTLSVLQAAGQRLVLITYRDVSQAHLQQFISDSQYVLTQALACHAPPEEIFMALCKLVESCSAPGTFASVLWLMPDGQRLRHVASPSLPKSYTDAIDGIVIGPDVGSCGTAAYTGQRVIVADIETDALWKNFRALAQQYRLAACWSQPILAPGGKVLGTLAMYRDTKGAPSSVEQTLLDLASQIASMTIRDLRSKDEIHFQASLLDSVREAVIASDIEGRIYYWGQGATELFGVTADQMLGEPLSRVLDIVDGLETVAAEGRWSGEIELIDRDGLARTVEVSASKVDSSYNHDAGYVAILRDVSARRAAEARVVEQSRRHRAVADLGRQALGDITPQALFDNTLATLADILNASHCYIYELDAGQASLCLRAAVGMEAGDTATPRLPADASNLLGVALYAESPVLIDDRDGPSAYAIPEPLSQAGWVSGLVLPIHGDATTAYGILGVHTAQRHEFSDQDIHFLQSVANILAEFIRRRLATESLQYSEQRFRDLADSMPQIVWSANADGCPDYFNEHWERLVGPNAGAAQAGHEAWLTVLHPDNRQKWLDTWAQCVLELKPFEMECRIRVGQIEQYRWHLVRAIPVRLADSQTVRWYGSSTDIEDQKCIEHKLREQAHELEMVNWINSTLVSELDLEKLVQIVTDVGTQLSGASYGAYFHSVADPHDPCYSLYALSGAPRELFEHLPKPRVTELFGPTFRGEGVVRSDDILRDPRYGHAEPYRGLPEGHPPVRSYLAVPVLSRTGEVLGGMFFGHPEVGVFDADDERLIAGLATQASIAVDNASVYRDLNSSKNQARRQYEQLRAIYASAPVGLCFLDDQLRVVNMNDHLRSMFGCSGRQVEGQTLQALLGDTLSSLQRVCAAVLDGQGPVLNYEISGRKTDGDGSFYWLCSCYPIQDQAEGVIGINAVFQDITERKNSELESARLASIVSNSYDAIIGKTLDGTITSWNQGAERIYGYTAEEVIGQSVALLVPDHLWQQELEILERLSRGLHITSEEVFRRRKDGALIQVALTISPIRNSAGDIVGASTIARDITESKKAEQMARENEARMQLILRATRIGTWDWDLASQQVRWSENMEELHGREKGNFDGTFESVLADVYPEDRGLIEAAVNQAMHSGGDYHVEYRVLTHDNRVRWMEGKGQVLRDDEGEVVRMAGICMDVTERKEAEQALRISETALRTQTEELATAHRQKDEFLAMLAHELRNPLAPISNTVQLLKLQDDERKLQILPWSIDVIDRQVLQLSRLVDDLLDIARITRGRIELQSEYVDLRDVVRQAADAAYPWFEAKSQQFVIDLADQPIEVIADTARIVQTISNLLNNASKFTPEQGRIQLQAYVHQQEAVVSVSDNGIGIAAETLPDVFDPFTQADRSLDRRQGGLGLGLSLVRKLVELHGGRVTATSPGMGRGSEFTIRLPLAAAVAAEAPVSREDGLSLALPRHKLKILVVDDNVQSTDAMTLLLETLGHSVMAAYNGPDALRFAGQFNPDIVFLDIGLPLMDGYEVAERLRARHGNTMRLIALTGYAPQQGKQHPIETDFDQYILKPLSLEKLMSLLSNSQDMH